jgi:transcriptional regulator with XRE-family HTH domain
MTVATLLNTLSRKYRSINDKNLSAKLNMYPSTVSRIRRGEKNVGPAFILAVHEATDIPVKEIRRQLEQKEN